MTDRKKIAAQARTWIGTRFHHQGRVKKNTENSGGCDCIGLIVGVVDELGIEFQGRKLSDYDRTDYAKVPDGKELMDAFSNYMQPIDFADVEPGDILMFRFEKDPQHVGIVGEYSSQELSIIHCYMQAKKVVEHILDDHWKSRVVGGFRIIS